MKLKLSKNFFGFIAAFIFIITLFYLRVNNLIPNLDIDNKTKQELKNELKEITNIKISKEDIRGKIIFIDDDSIWVYDPKTQDKKELAKTLAIKEAGILNDGRLYFWQANSNGMGMLYASLFIQKDNSFEKYNLPLNDLDRDRLKSTKPFLAKDGESLIFASSRESENNLKRKALYQYNLNSFELKKLNQNNLISFDDPKLSQDNLFTSFIFQKIENNQAPTKSLGIIIKDNPNLNLFPKINLYDSIYGFSQDNQQIFLNTDKGFGIFDLNKGRVVEQLNQIYLKTYYGNLLVLVQEGRQIDPELAEKCQFDSKGKLNQISVYKWEAEKLQKIAARDDFDQWLEFPQNGEQNLFSPDGKQLLISLRNNQHCEAVLAIWDLDNNDLQVLNIKAESQPFWIATQ